MATPTIRKIIFLLLVNETNNVAEGNAKIRERNRFWEHESKRDAFVKVQR